MQKIRCPGCPAVLKVDEKLAGTKVACPRCKRAFTIASPVAAVASKTPVAEPAKPAATKTPPRPAPPPKEEVIDLTVDDMAQEEILDVVDAEPSESQKPPSRALKRRPKRSRTSSATPDLSFITFNRVFGIIVMVVGFFIFGGGVLTLAMAAGNGTLMSPYGLGQGSASLAVGAALLFRGYLWVRQD